MMKSEDAQLLGPHPQPEGRLGKGRCWCCWDATETRANPLIRPCRGCKDPDLQWIHQACIDTYLTKLPARMRHEAAQSRTVRFKCARCCDAYMVSETPVPLVSAVYQDAYLRRAVVMLLVSTSIVFVACTYSWYYENFVEPQKLMFDVWIPFGGSFQLGLTFFAGLMLALCYCLCLFTYYLLLDFFKSEVVRHVVGMGNEVLGS
ncbi:hypothetical protein BC830DRAFT_1145494 [Chytriomyces sp. MP71]|nr:hypothetical protein BC830DRAFT_1145494 [Chytriomyces sp. MP71]